MLPVRTILVPIDFSDPSRAALGKARELAEHWGAALRLLHAYSPPSGLPPGFAMDPDFEAKVAQAAEHALRDLARECGAASNVRVTVEVARGGPVEAIVAQARGADLVVMGTHGRTGLAQARLGSVAERVVRTAPCPVLTVHSS